MKFPEPDHYSFFAAALKLPRVPHRHGQPRPSRPIESSTSLNADADAVSTKEPTDDASDVTGQTDATDDEDPVVSHAHTFDVPTSS